MIAVLVICCVVMWRTYSTCMLVHSFLLLFREWVLHYFVCNIWLVLCLVCGLFTTSFLSCRGSCIWGSCIAQWDAGGTALWLHTLPGTAWSTCFVPRQTSAGRVRFSVKLADCCYAHTENLFICTFPYRFQSSSHVGNGWRPGN